MPEEFNQLQSGYLSVRYGCSLVLVQLSLTFSSVSTPVLSGSINSSENICDTPYV